ncbi:MAG: hypothetical protein KBG83_00130 [Bacteroidetes bacterium]|nr:hypothetical protein [Bacteroidota bacterium]
MNGFSQLWQDIVDTLNGAAAELGIAGAERAAMGQISTIIPPAAIVWINPYKAATQHSQNGALTFPTDIHIFCIAAPTVMEADAVDAALEIAKNILRFLSNKEIAGTILTQPDDEPALEIIERSSTQAIVAILLQAEIQL